MSDKLPYKVGEFQECSRPGRLRARWGARWGGGPGAHAGFSGPLESLARRDRGRAMPPGGWSSHVAVSGSLEAARDYKSRSAARGPVQRRGLRNRQLAACSARKRLELAGRAHLAVAWDVWHLLGPTSEGHDPASWCGSAPWPAGWTWTSAHSSLGLL